MALTIASMTLPKPRRCLGITNHHTHSTCSMKVLKPSSSPKLKDLTKSFVGSETCNLWEEGMAMAMAMACSVLSSLSCCNAAMAAEQIADVAEGGNRGLLLVAPLVPAILWALYNIFQPAVIRLKIYVGSLQLCDVCVLRRIKVHRSLFNDTPNICVGSPTIGVIRA